jgi:hypothetical protein
MINKDSNNKLRYTTKYLLVLHNSNMIRCSTPTSLEDSSNIFYVILKTNKWNNHIQVRLMPSISLVISNNSNLGKGTAISHVLEAKHSILNNNNNQVVSHSNPSQDRYTTNNNSRV